MRKRAIPVVGAALTVIAVGSMFTASANAHSTNTTVAAGHHAVQNVKFHPDGTACYDQMNSDQGNAGVSDKFTDQKTLNTKAADDFTLTSSCTVNEVDVFGGGYGWPGPVTSFNVTFYKDDGSGVPGKTMGTQHHLTYTYTDSGSGISGTYYIALNNAKTLAAGTYWVSVQAKMTLSTSGEWYWDGNTTQTGSPAAWKNPRNGFSTGCTTWCNELSSIGVGPDHMFAIVTNG